VPVINRTEGIERLLRPAARRSRDQSLRHGSGFRVAGGCGGWRGGGLAEEREEKGGCADFERTTNQSALLARLKGGALWACRYACAGCARRKPSAVDEAWCEAAQTATSTEQRSWRGGTQQGGQG